MDFLEEHKTALYLTGTVSIPSPYPANARVYVVPPSKELGQGAHFIKIVQILNEKQFHTWFVNLDDVVAVRAPGAASDKSLPHGGWIIKPAEEVKKKAIEILKDEKGKSNALLHHQAVVIVKEGAPVISRYELVTTAAEIFYPAAPCNPCCPPGSG